MLPDSANHEPVRLPYICADCTYVINSCLVDPTDQWLLSVRTVMRSMPVVLIERENENDSANQNDVAKMMLQK